MTFKRMLMIALVVLVCSVGIHNCYKDESGFIKPRAEQYYTQRGFEVVGYQGFNTFLIGRCYWYTISRDNNLFESCLLRWDNEIHEYNLTGISSIQVYHTGK